MCLKEHQPAMSIDEQIHYLIILDLTMEMLPIVDGIVNFYHILINLDRGMYYKDIIIAKINIARS